MPPRATDAGWITHDSDEHPGTLIEHPGVVMRVVVKDDVVVHSVVVHGTSTPRNRKGARLSPEEVPAEPNAEVFWVEADSLAGRELQLTGRTYFAFHRSIILRPGREALDFRRTGSCPGGLFLKLREIHGITA